MTDKPYEFMRPFLTALLILLSIALIVTGLYLHGEGLAHPKLVTVLVILGGVFFLGAIVVCYSMRIRQREAMRRQGAIR